MASSQRKPACLMPHFLGHKSTLDGDICSKKSYRERLTPIKGKIFLFCPDRTNSPPSGASPLHQFWSYNFLSLLFRHAWDTAQPPTGRVLAGVQMGCRQGWLRRVKEQKDLLTWGSHLLVIPMAWLVPWPGAIWHSLQHWDVEGWLNWLPGPRASLYGLCGFAPLS